MPVQPPRQDVPRRPVEPFADPDPLRIGPRIGGRDLDPFGNPFGKGLFKIPLSK